MADLHGNVSALAASGSSPAILTAYRYDPYGETCGSWILSGSDSNPWRFQGRILESASGATDLYDFGARSYDPSLGAFTSFDTLAGGAVNPLTLNRYLYASANPVTMIDPDGHCSVSPNSQETADICARESAAAAAAQTSTSSGTGSGGAAAGTTATRSGAISDPTAFPELPHVDSSSCNPSNQDEADACVAPDMDQANKIFQAVKDWQLMAWDKTANFCWARAELIMEAMQAAGLYPGKIWSFSDVYVDVAAHPGTSGHLDVQTVSGETQPWDFHVAATIPVRQPNGQIITMVIDPETCDGPVPIDQWLSKQSNVAAFVETRPGEPARPVVNVGTGLSDEADRTNADVASFLGVPASAVDNPDDHPSRHDAAMRIMLHVSGLDNGSTVLWP